MKKVNKINWVILILFLCGGYFYKLYFGAVTIHVAIQLMGACVIAMYTVEYIVKKKSNLKCLVDNACLVADVDADRLVEARLAQLVGRVVDE